MRYEYVEPFVKSTVGVLGSALRSPVGRGEVSLSRGGEPQGEVSISVPLSGDSDGDVVLRMNRETAASICARLSGAVFDAFSPEGLDMLSELANMITGNAVSVLNDQGFAFAMLPPRAAGKEGAAAGTAGLETFRIPLATDCGEVTIHVALKTP